MSEETGPYTHQDEPEGLAGSRGLSEHPAPYDGPPCVTHFSGCDCREAAHARALEAERARAERAERAADRWRRRFERRTRLTLRYIDRSLTQTIGRERAEATARHHSDVRDEWQRRQGEALDWATQQRKRAEVAEATARDLYALVDERSALLEACATERAALAARVAELEAELRETLVQWGREAKTWTA